MPKATAVWLIENTSLTFEQIADFCDLHILEIQGIADEEVAKGIKGIDPIAAGQLTADEIKRCENNHDAKLQIAESAAKLNAAAAKAQKGKYTPVARRQDKPNAIAWIIANAPEISDLQITKLIGTTKTTIESIREKSHWNSKNIVPKDPVLLGICSQAAYDKVYNTAVERMKAQEERMKKEISKEIDSKSN